MVFTPERLSSALDVCLATLERPAAGICVASSGGLDSTVLLAGLAMARGSGRLPSLRAVHVDHGLHADSPQWAQRCAMQAAATGVPFKHVTVDARSGPGESPEAAARKARYTALARELGAGEVLLTAHHADDQLETILLQWLRGGGLRAVAGMAPVTKFAAGWHARPLLGFSREELRAWAEGERLQWLDDPSNLDVRFDRNFLRLEVLPAIRSRWPAAARTVGRVAAQAAEALGIEDEMARADLASVAEGGAVSVARLRSLPPARQRWALRAWLRRLGLPVPSARTLAALRHDMAASATDRVPCVNWPGARVYRYRGRLFGVADAGRQDSLPEGTWQPGADFELGAFGRLALRPATGVGLSRARLPAELRITVRSSGEQFRPAGAAHRRPLRKWLQERGVLPWCRQQIPLVLAGREIAAIGDLAYGAEYCAEPDEPSWVIVWHGRPALTEHEALEARQGH